MTTNFTTAFVAATALLAVVCPAALAHGSVRQFAHGSVRQVDQTSKRDVFAWVGETGSASFYGPDFHGHRSASGDRFDQKAMTAAHAWLPFGTRVKVVRGDTGRSVIVTITDRVYSDHRVVDLSLAAARALGMIRRGIAEVTLTPI